MKKSNSKNNLSGVVLRNDPFPYCHKYRLFLVNSWAKEWIEYVFHCDYANAKSSQCIQALKKRLQLGYSSCKVQNIRLIQANYKSKSYESFAKKRDLIVQQALINKA
jgi:hypothetical protein